eukprot:477480_1
MGNRDLFRNKFEGIGIGVENENGWFHFKTCLQFYLPKIKTPENMCDQAQNSTSYLLSQSVITHANIPSVPKKHVSGVAHTFERMEHQVKNGYEKDLKEAKVNYDEKLKSISTKYDELVKRVENITAKNIILVTKRDEELLECELKKDRHIKEAKKEYDQIIKVETENRRERLERIQTEYDNYGRKLVDMTDKYLTNAEEEKEKYEKKK